jgi:hydroxymethylbilane synthase
MKVIIGSRGSELALYQANLVKSRLESSGATADIKIIKTVGDRIDNLSFDKIEGKGFFTKEIEEALLAGDIDLAVHSLKDLSTQMPSGLKIAGYYDPEDPSEALLINPGKYNPGRKLFLDDSAVIGTSSIRRQAQIAYLRSDLKIEPLRGNVPTRIRKLREGKYDAIIIANAGIRRLRLDLSDLKYIMLDRFEFIPAPGQGILAIQSRENEVEINEIVAQFNDKEAELRAELERGLLARFHGGCQLPLAVISSREEDEFRLRAFLGVKAAQGWGRPKVYDGSGKSILELIENGYKALKSLNDEKRKMVLITRTKDESEGDLVPLSALADIIYYPVIDIVPDYEGKIKDILQAVEDCSWIIFTSRNAARFMRDILKKESKEIPKEARIAAVGQKTAALLKGFGWRVDLTPSNESAEGLLDEFAVIKEDNGAIFLPQGDDAPDKLESGLRALGFEANRIAIYKAIPRSRELLPEISSPDIDFFIFTSPLAVKYFKTLGHIIRDRAWAAAIGKPTAEALEKHYRRHDYMPVKADIGDIAKKIRERLENGNI